MNLAVYVFVFNIVLKSTWGADQSPLEVVLLMLVGIVAWRAFQEGISRATNILVDHANLIEKVVFPTAVLPAYVVTSALVNMAIAVPIVGIVLAYAMLNPTTDPQILASAAQTGNEGIQIGIATLALPLLLLVQGVFTLGLAYFLAAFNLFWRDAAHLIPVALTVWMFLTPIFYPAFHVEQKGFGWTLDINPMHWLMEMYRATMVKNTWPQLWDVVRFTIAATVMFVLGTRFFSAHRTKFADLV